ncbi:central glycolytic genes regulator [Lysinibacillus sphaericus]|uniref:Central glycolytic genes regulator n=1 Tax=Lysinibacillus sphaericus TaxID=1421 RepID=A0A2S5CW40_LYSSH|nr:sugar-binding domain-containing protein [Lysinibacillus sphaericus]POZ55039.1 central glycolytic genes regulator [Lysinibacillus sphaericus]
MLTVPEAQRRLLPEMNPLLQSRYRILQSVQLMQPIGRRTLAESLKMTEREIRKETDILREQGLLDSQKSGMVCTSDGELVIEQLRALVYEWSGLTQLGKALEQQLGLQHVLVVPGDYNDDETVLTLLGKEAAQQFLSTITNEQVVAVTGGKSVASLAQFLQPVDHQQNITFVAARGGIGHEMHMQANTLVATFAMQMDAQHRTLFLPEHLSEQAYQAMLTEPMVTEIMAYYDRADCVIHGIGSAEEMAIRRNTSAEDLRILEEKGAVSEAFGYYFNAEGQIVHRIRTIGIQLEQVEKCKHIIAVAAGKQKVNAMLSYFKVAPKQTIFITDEAAAKAIAERLL